MDKPQERFNNMEQLKSEPQGPTFKSFIEWKNSKSDQKNQAVAFWKQYLAAGYKSLEGV